MTVIEKYRGFVSSLVRSRSEDSVEKHFGKKMFTYLNGINAGIGDTFPFSLQDLFRTAYVVSLVTDENSYFGGLSRTLRNAHAQFGISTSLVNNGRWRPALEDRLSLRDFLEGTLNREAVLKDIWSTAANIKDLDFEPKERNDILRESEELVRKSTKTIDGFDVFAAQRVKRSITDDMLSKVLPMKGDYNPVTGEVNIVHDLESIYLPFEACRLKVAARGNRKEHEQFARAYIACENGSPLFQYSAQVARLEAALDLYGWEGMEKVSPSQLNERDGEVRDLIHALQLPSTVEESLLRQWPQRSTAHNTLLYGLHLLDDRKERLLGESEGKRAGPEKFLRLARAYEAKNARYNLPL